MAIDELLKDPAHKTHAWFSNSALNLPAAPEYATGEVLLAGACRKLLLGIGESEIDLAKIDDLPARLTAAGSQVPEATWEAIFEGTGGLRSPTVKGQSRTKVLPQLCPVVPLVGEHAGVLGKPRNRWNPGNLVIGTISAGAPQDQARARLVALRQHLIVGDTDDFAARFIERELSRLRGQPLPAEDEVLGRPEIRALLSVAPRRAAQSILATPAEQACADLPHVLALKDRLTRRQWTALLEGFLRLALGAHLLWLCRLNQRCWTRALAALDATAPLPTADELEREYFDHHVSGLPILHLGQNALPLFRAHVEQYAIARFGFSVLAHQSAALPALHQAGQPVGRFAEDFRSFLAWLRDHRGEFAPEAGTEPAAWVRGTLARILDRHPKFAAAAKGTFGNNLFEYLRHTLGQTQATYEQDSEYDQSYLLRRAGSSWIVNPGPAMQLLWVHLCCRAAGGNASLLDLAAYLRNYGISMPEILATRQAPMRLEQLGLVVDSPDAAGGRMLVDPFPASQS